MLGDPRTREMIVRFVEDWLRLGEIGTTVKDGKMVKDFERLRGPLQRSAQRFVQGTIDQHGGSLEVLLTSTRAWADQRLAPLLDATAQSAEMNVVSMDPARRAGILTHPGLLALNAKATATGPIKRGVYLREVILGEPLSPPPPGADEKLPELRPGMTIREQMAAHAEEPRCSLCHELIDSLGLAFENYDLVGRWRDTDRDLPIDPSGEAIDSDVGRFEGPLDLVRKLARSAQVRRALVTRVFRSAFGRAETAEDACAVAALEAAFASRGARIVDLFQEVVLSDAFRHRSVPGGPS